MVCFSHPGRSWQGSMSKGGAEPRKTAGGAVVKLTGKDFPHKLVLNS